MLLTIVRNLALKGFGIPASFGCLILLANSLGAERFGHYSLLISIVVMISAALNKFYSVMLVRELVQAKTNNRSGRASGIVVLCLSLTLVITALILIAGKLFIPNDLVTAPYFTYLVFITLLTVASGATLRGLGNVELGLLVEQILRPVVQLTLLIFLLLPLLDPFRNDINVAIATYAISLSFASALGIMLCVRNWTHQFGFKKPKLKKSWITISGPSLLMLGLIGGLNTQLPVLLMGLLTSANEIGTYRVATGISTLIAVVLIAVNMATGPQLAKIAVTNDMNLYETKLRTGCTIAAALSIVLSVGFVAFDRHIIELLFSSDYNSAESFLWICCLAQSVNCFFGPVSLAFNMLGKESSNIYAVVFAIFMGLAVGFLLIPNYGALGAAITMLVSTTTWNLYLVVLLKNKYDVLCLPYSPIYLLKNKRLFQ